jgi:hypothetical protein
LDAYRVRSAMRLAGFVQVEVGATLDIQVAAHRVPTPDESR